MEKNDGSTKGQIVKYFNSALKSLQEEIVDHEDAFESNDSTNALCWSIEAMFLHGMRNSKSNKDFWALLKKCMHKSTLEQIKSFNQIKSDIGRCRAWLRLSINECCLECYLPIIVNDSALIGRYYFNSAFLLDVEATGAVMKSVQNLANYHFNLPCNSTVLNQWNQPPLQLAGKVSAENLRWPRLKNKGNGNANHRPSLATNCSASETSSTNLPCLLVQSTANLKDPTLFPRGSITSSKSVGNLDNVGNKKPATDHGTNLSISTASSFERDDVSEASCNSHPDFRDARQEFYRTVYDISESEEEELKKSKGGGSTASNETKSTEAKSVESDLKFKLIVKNNLDKFPLNYDQKLSASLEIEESENSRLYGIPASIETKISHLGVKLPAQNTPETMGEKPLGVSSIPVSLLDSRASNCIGKLDDLNPPLLNVLSSGIDGCQTRNESEMSGMKSNGQSGLLKLAVVLNPVDSVENCEENVGNNVEEGGNNVVDDDFVMFEYSTTEAEDSHDRLITIEKIIASVVGKDKQEVKAPQGKNKRNAIHENIDKETDIIKQYTSIRHEKGLASQCFQCKACSAPIGMFFGKERTCSFDKCYYCPDCLDKSDAVIPNRVIFNWDFRPYKVSKRNLEYLMIYKAVPLTNIEDLNPSLYDHVPALKEVKMARVRLKHLKAYLLSCSLDLVIDLHSHLHSQSYYTENIHTYSIEDLVRVPSGHLIRTINKACNFAINHVFSCPLCSQKGFYCEICREGKIIYPFDLVNTIRCDSCKAVYHKTCKTPSKACPKCQRLAMRNSFSLSPDTADTDGVVPTSLSSKGTSHSFTAQESVNYTYTAVVG